MKTVLNEKLLEVLKEEVTNTSNNLNTEDDVVAIATGVRTGEDESSDIHFNPSKQEIIQTKTKNGESSLNFIPLADFKPEVYGLSSDVFDRIEQTNSFQNSTQQVIGSDNSEIEQVQIAEYDPAYEENYGFERGKNLAAIEDEPADVTITDFEDIEDNVLLEYAYSKGVDFTTRKKTIQTLFEHNKVTKKELDGLKAFVKKSKLNEEVALLEEDEFLAKFGKDLDFRNIENTTIISPLSNENIYNLLDNLSPEDWNSFQQGLQEYNISIDYDPAKDSYILKPVVERLEEELYEIESEDKQIIENIIKPTNYILKEVKGMPKSSGKSHMLNVIVEKDNHQTTIVYNDNKNIKPWSIEGKEFNTLTESLNNICIPFKTLVRETTEANLKVAKRKTLLEEIRKESWNKTKNLPLAEKEIRTNRSITLIKSMFKESEGDDETISYLEELKKIDSKYNG